ncbi:hypothetical protein ES702_07107 [subsurface metagenome]
MKRRTGESMKDLMLGEESYKRKSTSKTVKQHTSKTVKRQTDKPAKQNKVNKKVTYYIKNPTLIKKLKHLGVEKERDLSSLVTEAIEDLIKKYK